MIRTTSRRTAIAGLIGLGAALASGAGAAPAPATAPEQPSPVSDRVSRFLAPAGSTGGGAARPGAFAPPLSEIGQAGVVSVPPAPSGLPVRALWVIRTSLYTPPKIDALLRQARDMGVRTLLVQVVGRGDAYYSSSILPQAERVDPGFNPLGYLLPRAHAQGVEVYAWVNCFLAWSGYDPPLDVRHVVNADPQWIARSADGRSLDQYTVSQIQALHTEGIFLAPANPSVRRYLRDVVREIVQRYDVDGVYLDYVRSPALPTGYDEVTRTAFERRYYVEPPKPGQLARYDNRESALWGSDLPDNDPQAGETTSPVLEPGPIVGENPGDVIPEIRAPEPPPSNDASPVNPDLYARWVGFKADQITAAVAGVRDEMARWRPGLKLGASVIPDIAHARNDLGQDWTRWLAEGLVDFVTPMFYAPSTPLVEDQLRTLTTVVSPDRVWAGIAAYNQAPAAAAAKIRAAREVGVADVALFSYDTLAVRRGWYRELLRSIGTR